MAAQILRHHLVGGAFEIIALPQRILVHQALILLRPVNVVAAIVMVARAGHGDFEEIRVAQNRVRRREAAAGMAEDPDAIEIDELVLRRELLDRRDVVRQTVVAEVAIVVVVERLRAMEFEWRIPDVWNAFERNGVPR